MKAVILESYVMQEGDLDWSGVYALVPDTTAYVRTDYDQIAQRIGDADFVLLNKCRMDEEILSQCPNLKWVGIIATGTDNLDLEACRRHGVQVANVPGYSTYSVAQMTFSLLLAVCQCAERQNRAVQDGHWQLNVPAEYRILPQVELFGKTFGIFGYGSIGRQAGRIAKAFGMRVLACTRTVRPEYAADGVEFVDFDTLLKESDVLSLHTPATPATRGVISAAALEKIKPGCNPGQYGPGRSGGRGGSGRGPEKRAAGLLRGGRLRGGAAARRQPPPGPAQCSADPPYCLDHQGGPAKADGYHHPKPAQFPGRRRGEHRQPLRGQGWHRQSFITKIRRHPAPTGPIILGWPSCWNGRGDT